VNAWPYAIPRVAGSGAACGGESVHAKAERWDEEREEEGVLACLTVAISNYALCFG